MLVKLLADAHDTSSELHTMIDEPNDIVLDEVEEPLRSNGHYSALAKLYQKVGDISKLLDVWSKFVFLPAQYLLDSDVQSQTR